MALRSLPTTHPYLTYNALILPISYVALSTTPSLPSISLLLSILILQTTTLLNRAPKQMSMTLLTLALGSTLANFSASTTALSSTAGSLVLTLLRGAFTAGIVLVILSMRWTITRQATTTTLLASPLVRMTAFPALWTLCWALVSAELPIGRLGSWTPLVGDDAYRWMRPYFGLSGEDFVVAAWAEVGAAFAGMWMQGFAEEEEEESEESALIGSNGQHQHQTYGSTAQPTRKTHPRNTSPLILASLLFLLTLPSYYISPLPLPIYSADTTPLSVACVLPPQHNPNSPKTPLDELIKETRSIAPRARIVLWPEGAVAFRTATEKQNAIERVRNTTEGSGLWIGMAFEEPVEWDAKESSKRSRMVRNGMAFIGPDGKHPVVFEYYKRNLVPIAESYSQVPGTLPPPVKTISLPGAKSLPPAERDTWPRSLTVSTSICLDFSQPLPLSAHPHLILAPARTWHPSIGRAMSLLAAARAEEVGAAVLWCDGGDGAVGGVYGFGRGSGAVEEVGNKGRSWVVKVGVPYVEGEERRERTVYAVFGAWAGLAGVLLFVGIGVGVERVVVGGSEDEEVVGRVMGWFKGTRRREGVESGRDVATGNLLDA